MKLFAGRKDSAPALNPMIDEEARSTAIVGGFSAEDLMTWRKHDAEVNLKHLRTSGGRTSPQSSAPVGLVGVVEEDSMDLLFANDKQLRKEHKKLKNRLLLVDSNEDSTPIAPSLSSKKRFQAVQLADTVNWNLDPSSVKKMEILYLSNSVCIERRLCLLVSLDCCLTITLS
jgi:hypothetical protein